MAVGEYYPVVLLLMILGGTFLVFADEVLTPPYFNLAQEQEIIATSTCGVGVSGSELYCQLTGATGDYANTRFSSSSEGRIVEGQNCDVCRPPSPEGSIPSNKEHPAKFAIDGTERWWQSPPLSRDMEYNEVNVTINLGQVNFWIISFSDCCIACVFIY